MNIIKYNYYLNMKTILRVVPRDISARKIRLILPLYCGSRLPKIKVFGRLICNLAPPKTDDSLLVF